MDQEIAESIIENIPLVTRLLRRQMRSHVKNQLTIPQFRLLLRLSQQPSSQSELAEWLGVTAPTMSKMIDSLLKNKMLTRQYQEKDRRKQKIELTIVGKKLIQKQQKFATKMFLKKIEKLTKNEKEKLKDGLEILIKLVNNNE